MDGYDTLGQIAVQLCVVVFLIVAEEAWINRNNQGKPPG